MRVVAFLGRRGLSFKTRGSGLYYSSFPKTLQRDILSGRAGQARPIPVCPPKSGKASQVRRATPFSPPLPHPGEAPRVAAGWKPMSQGRRKASVSRTGYPGYPVPTGCGALRASFSLHEAPGSVWTKASRALN